MCTTPMSTTLQVYLLGCTDPGSCVASLMRPLRSWSAPSPSSSDDHSSASETAASPSMNAAARLHGRTAAASHAVLQLPLQCRLLLPTCMIRICTTWCYASGATQSADTAGCNVCWTAQALCWSRQALSPQRRSATAMDCYGGCCTGVLGSLLKPSPLSRVSGNPSLQACTSQVNCLPPPQPLQTLALCLSVC